MKIMRMLALGCGAMGKIAINDLMKFGDNFSEIIVGDYNIEMTEKFLEKLKDKRLKAQFVNVEDFDNLVKLMKKVDVVLSCVGPFYKYGLNIVKAAIEAKVNLVDICDDYDVTQKVLELDKKAKDSNITIITGLGASPGTTNILAKLGTTMLDETEEIKISLVQSASDPECGAAVIYHIFHSMYGDVLTFCDSRYINVKAFADGCEVVEFLEPIGSFEVFHIGHPEPITLPKYIEGLKKVSCRLNLNPKEVKDIVVTLGNLGVLQDVKIKINENLITPQDFFVKWMIGLINSDRYSDVPYDGAIKVEVVGKKDNNFTKITFEGTGRMNEGTGIPVSIGAIMLAKGQVKEKGVYPPEAVIEPMKFIEELTKREMKGRIITETKIIQEF